MKKEDYKIELQINTQEIRMNPFVQNFFTNTLLGAIQSLKDIPENIDTVLIKINHNQNK